ncbi:DUF4433 domain-containing protein [Pseudomonas silvicola]|nr:DUF4433 domain-containing protein [Pseudomonas silvicola]
MPDTDIKAQKQLYHLAALENLSSILQIGLKPRSQLKQFTDVADAEILRKRQALELENYVPFHWFSANPFDGSVQRRRPESKFILISVYRSHAEQNGWKIIPRHPLANDAIQLYDYAQGLEVIDWTLMNSRDYSDRACKSTCMAECLSPGVVAADNFSRIYVRDTELERVCMDTMRSVGKTVPISVNPRMFPNV